MFKLKLAVHFHTSLIAIISLAIIACTDVPDFNVVPSLNFEGIDRNVLSQNGAKDSFYVRLMVTDADGDIGERENFLPTIFLIDMADGTQAFTFDVPRFDDRGGSNGIEAEIRLTAVVNRGDLCCRYPDGSSGCIPSEDFPVDSFFYETYLVDRAGNESNRVVVGPLYLTCD